MSNTSTSETTSNICANCGKEGSDVTNTCNKCKSVMYCNAACKKKHRHKHKKECERRVVELHDEALFKQPPQLEDCPVCFLRIPTLYTGRIYMNCCGKVICCGCIHAVQSRATKEEHDVCPFCRTPPLESEEETFKRTAKRVEMNDPMGISDLGCMYRDGTCGVSQSYARALELWHRAGELGSADAYYGMGNAYLNGNGVEIDKKKAKHYFEVAAIRGNANSRFVLGFEEHKAGNMERALKHFIIANKGGHGDCLKIIKLMYKNGSATKDDYAKALRAYQAYLDEIKSDQRDEAAAAKEEYKYYDSPF